MGASGRISEVFSSIQGEGVYVGCPQLFVRLDGCNLHCRFCDTPRAASVETMTAGALTDAVLDMEKRSGPHHAVSITGGEPLLQAEFLAEFLPMLKSQGFRTYLETNGTLPEALRQVIAGAEIVAMDIKLESASGEPARFAANRAFLTIAAEKEAFVKIVVTADVDADEFTEAVDVIADVDPAIPLVIQPVTADGTATPPPAGLMTALRQTAGSALSDVRVIPQVHKLMKWQ